MKPNIYELNIAMDIVVDLLNRGLKEAIDEGKYNEWQKNRFVESHAGCTKIVFLPAALPNWVIKTDINNFHLCHREVENYKLAEEMNLASYFAETFYLCEKEGLYFLIQRRGDMETAHSTVQKAFYDSIIDTYKPWNENETPEEREENISEMCDDMWDSERIFAIYGCEDECDDLIDFIELRMCNDLHSGNFAMINGEIVLIDFSGYWTDKELEDFE